VASNLRDLLTIGASRVKGESLLDEDDTKRLLRVQQPLVARTGQTSVRQRVRAGRTSFKLFFLKAWRLTEGKKAEEDEQREESNLGVAVNGSLLALL